MKTYKLSDSMTSFGSCSRCILRASVDAASQKEYELGVCDIELEDLQHRHCGSCLGILEEDHLRRVANMVAEKVNSSNYESKDFSLAISLPQSLVIRQKSLISFINKNKLLEEVATTASVLVKDALKFSILLKVEQMTDKKHDNKSELLVKLTYVYEDDTKEIARLNPLLPKQNNKKRKFYHRNKKFDKKNNQQPDNSIQSIMQAVQKLNDIQLEHYTACPPETIPSPCSFEVNICQGSIFMAGRYNKYSRELSQTPWVIEGERKTESSVQELISERIQKAVSSLETKFLSSGREDVDVKMLGKGRPFAVELIDPKRTNISQEEISQLQKDINCSTNLIAIRDLQLIDRDGLLKLKQGEEDKSKCYRAKIWCPYSISDEKIISLNSMRNVVLAQKTPIRVLHRRPIDTRQRMVHQMNMHRLDNEHYELTMKTQAGTYIKEFVHSDFGRTVPSLRSLLDAPVDILELDVDAVELDWPPILDEIC